MDGGDDSNQEELEEVGRFPAVYYPRLMTYWTG